MDEFVAKPCTTDLYYLGECCRWDDLRQELYWIDVTTGLFFRAKANATQIDIVRSYELDGYLTALAPMENRSDGWIVASNQSISLLDEEGNMSEVDRLEADIAPDVRTNDGACDPWGRFWIGSMALNAAEGRGSLYRFQCATGTEKIFAGVTISNGIGWSPEHRTMYYVDSGPGTIHTFDVNESGELSNKQVFVQFDVEREGTPDGLCVDSLGAIWVAVWGGYEVRRYSPAGELVARVKVAAAQPSSYAIGGSNGTTLYITTAQEDLPPETLVAEPDGGRLFCVDVRVTGLPIDAFRPTIPRENKESDCCCFP